MGDSGLDDGYDGRVTIMNGTPSWKIKILGGEGKEQYNKD